jgi:hypothetical protein
MSSGNNSGGVSRARIRGFFNNYRAPAPVLPMPPIVLAASTVGDQLEQIVVPGLNFTKDTAVVLVRDAAAADEPGEVTSRTVVPSGKNILGAISVEMTFSNTPAAVANYYQVYLTGPNGQRVWLGTVSVA